MAQRSSQNFFLTSPNLISWLSLVHSLCSDMVSSSKFLQLHLTPPRMFFPLVFLAFSLTFSHLYQNVIFSIMYSFITTFKIVPPPPPPQTRTHTQSPFLIPHFIFSLLLITSWHVIYFTYLCVSPRMREGLLFTVYNIAWNIEHSQ